MSLELVPGDEGPALPGSPLRNALDLLVIRGCKVAWRPSAKGVMEVYVVKYRDPAKDTPTIERWRNRLFYTDDRGIKQAIELLGELNTDERLSSPAEAIRNASVELNGFLDAART